MANNAKPPERGISINKIPDWAYLKIEEISSLEVRTRRNVALVLLLGALKQMEKHKCKTIVQWLELTGIEGLNVNE